MKQLVTKIKTIPVVYRMFKSLKHSYQRAAGLRHPIQDTRTVPDYKLNTLGSKHCGWTFVDDPKLRNGIILAAGLGEDGSFDVEFAAAYSAYVHIVDPTPRAVAHFHAIIGRIGKSNEIGYSETGTQKTESYNLQDVTTEQLKLHELAIWNERTTVKFFLPKETSHVSHSIVNFQNDYAKDTPFIEVDAMPICDLLNSEGIDPNDVAMLKLDIEGAEIEVIENIVRERFLPQQILVEFDEFNKPTRRGVQRIVRAHDLLVKQGYRIIYTDGQADFLYVREQKSA